jgi:uncharacterized protein (TIGR03083 family)
MSLSPGEWQAQTIASQWKVKDVVAHLLDGNIRALSMQRDGYNGVSPGDITSNDELITWLNRLNAEWITAFRRVSPSVLTLLHKATGEDVSNYFASLDPFQKAIWAVNWAGEQESLNWMHTAREYTEKWLHQQQIRDAVNKPGIMTREFYHPFINTFMLALPFTYKNIAAKQGTVIKLTVTSDAGDNWFLVKKEEKWDLIDAVESLPESEVIIDPDTAWKLFSKSLRPENIRSRIEIKGNQDLGANALNMISVMA